MRGRRLAALSVTIVVGLLATACGTAISGSATPDPDAAGSAHGPADLPYMGKNRQAEKVFTTMRTWDICAMHDPAAAEELTGDAVLSLAPAPGIGSCTMGMAKGVTSEWGLTIRLRNLDEVGKELKRGGIVGGKLVYRWHGDYGCSYVLPYQEIAGIEVGVLPPDGGKAGEKACSLAKSYLDKLLPTFGHPPLLKAGLTTPRLELAGKDPCVALAAVKGRYREPGMKAIVLGPYSCALSATGGGKDGPSVLFAYGMARSAKPSEAVTVAGLHGAAREVGGKCRFSFPVGTPVAADRFANRGYREILRITMRSCDHKQRVASMIKALHLEPLKSPRHPKLRLGVRTGYLAKQAGAPFDPCRAIGWQAFPERLREGKLVVRPIDLPKGSMLKLACDFHSDKIDTLIGWGSTTGEDDIRKHDTFADAKKVTVAGHEVLSSKGKAGDDPNCADAVLLKVGFAGVSTSALNGSHVDPCDLDSRLITKLAPHLR